MIDDLRAMVIFAKVAESGSFTAASRSLNLSTSVVSHHVKKLEARHGVSLMRRSTRALSLTEEGERLLEFAKRATEAAEDGLDAITAHSLEPTGSLRITLPSFLANSHQENAIWEFARRYPKVSITLRSTDEIVNLVSEGFDLAIRLGKVNSRSLESTKIGSFERCLVTAPSYLESVNPLVIPNQLSYCSFIHLNMLPNSFSLERGKKKITVNPEHSSVIVDSVAAARSALLAGLGIQRLPLSEVQDDLQTGRLVRVLTDWSLPKLGIYAAWPISKHPPSLVSLFLETLRN